MLWIIGLHPIRRPQVGELVTCDQDGAVAIAAQLLREAGQDHLADRLKPRPVAGAGREPQSQHLWRLRYQPCWHEYADVVNAALHEGPVELTRGRVGTDLWRAAKRARASVYCW